jgi:hypothetical protein
MIDIEVGTINTTVPVVSLVDADTTYNRPSLVIDTSKTTYSRIIPSNGMSTVISNGDSSPMSHQPGQQSNNIHQSDDIDSVSTDSTTLEREEDVLAKQNELFLRFYSNPELFQEFVAFRSKGFSTRVFVVFTCLFTFIYLPCFLYGTFVGFHAEQAQPADNNSPHPPPPPSQQLTQNHQHSYENSLEYFVAIPLEIL